MADNDIDDDDMTSAAPMEERENLDQGGDGPKDTGDEPTEADENLDAAGEDSKDTGDES